MPWHAVEVTRAQGGMMQVWRGHKQGVTRHGEATSGWGAPSHAPGDGAMGAGISMPPPHGYLAHFIHLLFQTLWLVVDCNQTARQEGTGKARGIGLDCLYGSLPTRDNL